MAAVTLSPELEGFAERCVASGRYGDVGEVVAAGLRLLRAREEKMASFQRSLDEAMAEAEAGQVFEWEEVAAEMDAIMAEEEAKRGGRGGV